MQPLVRIVAFVSLCLLLCPPAKAQTADPRYYNIGNPTLAEIWVDPVNGNDGNSGASRTQALRTLKAAWNRIPPGVTLSSTGYRIKLAPGNYTADAIPTYWDSRFGTFQYPIIIQAADGRNTVTISAFLNIYGCRYLYLIDLNITPDPAQTAIHFEKLDHALVRGVTMNGRGAAPQVLKINNSDYIYIEECDIYGSSGTSTDFVATRNVRIINNRLHDAGSWALFVKGGSAYIHVEGNELFNANRGGFAAGQTTGFEYLDSPWLHYEAYDVKFVNNIVHDTGGGGMAVNGGYNILFAYNTLYRVGGEGYAVEVLYGLRVCAGDTARCASNQSAGGWGTADGEYQKIPNRNVFIYNNIVYNPAGYQSKDAHFAIFGPQTNAPGSNIPSPAYLDKNLQIRGNLIWDGPKNHPLGTEYTGVGCDSSNPTCNETQLRAENTINAIEPQLINPANGDFRPIRGTNIINAKTFAIPDFNWNDAPSTPVAPAGNLANTITRDRGNASRNSTGPAGAYAIPTAAVVSAANYKSPVANESLVAAFGTNLAPTTLAATVTPLPYILAGTSVTVTDSAGVSRLAPLFIVSPAQINYQIPPGTATGDATANIENTNGSYSIAALQITNVAPGVFAADASGKGLAAASVFRIRANGSQGFEPVARYDSSQNRFVPVPIDLGGEADQVFLVLYGTGIRFRSSLNAVQSSVGGLDSQVLFAGAQGSLVGVDQVNIRLSRSLIGRGDVDVSLIVDGMRANMVTVNVQ